MLKAIHLFVSLSWPDKVSQNCFRFRTFHSSFFVATKWTEMRTVKKPRGRKKRSSLWLKDHTRMLLSKASQDQPFYLFPMVFFGKLCEREEGKSKSLFLQEPLYLLSCISFSVYILLVQEEWTNNRLWWNKLSWNRTFCNKCFQTLFFLMHCTDITQ